MEKALRKFLSVFFAFFTLMPAFGANVQKTTIKNSELRVAVGHGGGPIFSNDVAVQALESVIASVHGQLLYVNRSFSLNPGLISHFAWDFKNNWYVLELRPGTKFHNGREATAIDLEFSILRGLIGKRGTWAKSFFANIEGIAAAEGVLKFKSGMVSGISPLDRYRLRIKLSAPNPSFLHSLARSYFSLVPMEELGPDLYTWKRFPVGAGSYKVTAVNDAGSKIVLEKIDRSGNGPERIVISTQANFKNPDIDLLALRDGLEPVASGGVTSVTGIYFNYDNVLGKNPKFRKAISFAIKRQELIQGVSSYSATAELLPGQFWGRCGCVERASPKEASDLLHFIPQLKSTEAIRIPVFNSSFGDASLGKYLNVLRSQLKASGLNVEFVGSDKKFFDKSDSQTPFRIISLGADVADPLVLFGLFREGSPMAPHYPPIDPEYDRLYQLASRAETIDKRSEAVKALSRYFVDKVIAVPLFERRSVIGVNHARVKSLGTQDGGNTLFFDRLEFL